jgi:hypothetical protein
VGEGRENLGWEIDNVVRQNETRTVLTHPGKGNRIAADAAERVEDDVAATVTPLCYLRSDRLSTRLREMLTRRAWGDERAT